MKEKENEKTKNKLSFSDKLAIFDKNSKNVHLNKTNYKNNIKKENNEDKKIINSLKKNLQPKKNIDISNKIKIYEPKRTAKINDNKKIIKFNKPVVEKRKTGKEEMSKNRKIEGANISKKKDFAHFTNYNESEKNKKQNQNLENSKGNKYYISSINNKNFNNQNIINNKPINNNTKLLYYNHSFYLFKNKDIHFVFNYDEYSFKG